MRHPPDRNGPFGPPRGRHRGRGGGGRAMRPPHDRTGRFGPRGGGHGGRGSRADEDVPAADGLEAWFTGRLPDGWFTEPPTITTDRDEILVVGKIEPPEAASDPAGK